MNQKRYEENKEVINKRTSISRNYQEIINNIKKEIYGEESN